MLILARSVFLTEIRSCGCAGRGRAAPAVRRVQGRLEAQFHDEGTTIHVLAVGVQDVGYRLDPSLEGQDGAGAGAGDAHLEGRAGLLPEAKSGGMRLVVLGGKAYFRRKND